VGNMRLNWRSGSFSYLYTEVPDQKWILVDFKGQKSAIINNVFDGAVATVLLNKKVEVFGKKISNEHVTGEFLLYLLESVFDNSEAKMLAWIETVDCEEVERLMVMYSLDAG
jgi:hypothetical protein